MKWFKHDTDAHRDTKLKKLVMRHGMAGYGLYFYCLELIAGNTDQDNLTFSIEDDSEIIAHDTGLHQKDVESMMLYMVELGLFESSKGVITCLKMAKRLDKSMTSNPLMRKLIDGLNHDRVMTESELNHDGVMTKSGKVMQDKNRIEENRIEEIRVEEKEKKPRKRVTALRPNDVSETVWEDYLQIRKAKKSPLTQTALDGIKREADKAGVSLEQALTVCCERGWAGFKAEWYSNAVQTKTIGKPERTWDSLREEAEVFTADFLKRRKMLGYTDEE